MLYIWIENWQVTRIGGGYIRLPQWDPCIFVCEFSFGCYDLVFLFFSVGNFSIAMHQFKQGIAQCATFSICFPWLPFPFLFAVVWWHVRPGWWAKLGEVMKTNGCHYKHFTSYCTCSITKPNKTFSSWQHTPSLLLPFYETVMLWLTVKLFPKENVSCYCIAQRVYQYSNTARVISQWAHKN